MTAALPREQWRRLRRTRCSFWARATPLADAKRISAPWPSTTTPPRSLGSSILRTASWRDRTSVGSSASLSETAFET
jgi:hypothetical protein